MHPGGGRTCASNCVTAGTGLKRLHTTKPAATGRQGRQHGGAALSKLRLQRLHALVMTADHAS